MNWMNRFVVVLFVVTAGCEPQSSQAPETVNVRAARGTLQGMPAPQAYAYLEKTAQAGERVGDLVTIEDKDSFLIMADSVVVGLKGRGSRNIDPKLRPFVVKALVKSFDSLEVAEQILAAKDAAPVRCVAVLPAFVRKGDKIDVAVEALDPAVNLEGGTLVDTALERFVQFPGATHRDFRTTSGLVSAGVQAYARGDVTLNPGYRQGEQIRPELPTTGYVPAGALVDNTWGCRLMLKKPDTNTALLIDAAIRRRFGEIASSAHVGFIAVGMPNRYLDYKKRYVDVLLQIEVRPPSREGRLARIDKLAASLGTSDLNVRYGAECALDAYGPEAAPALLEASKSGNSDQRQSALRVLAFFSDKRSTPVLVEESRTARGPFRAESAALLAFLGGDDVEQRLVEMLSDTDPSARYQAFIALDKLGAKNAPIKTYYSPEQRNLAMSLVEVPGDKAVIIHSANGVRRIVLFGAGVTIKPGFRGSVGPVELNVTKDATEVRHKLRPEPEPLVWRTVELRNVVTQLDLIGVSVNDIIGLVTLMDKKAALDASVSWAE
jgi:flagellar basal body P-ring protein FlgI